VGVTELRDLTNKILLFLNQEFDLESASVFILRSDETVYVRVDGIDDRQLSIQSLLSNHRFIDFFRWLDQKSYSPIILDRFVETELARSMSVLQKNIFNEVLATLKSLNSNIAIPLIIKKEEKLKIHGFISMKGKKPPNAWDEDWSVLSLVYPYFIECAQKLSNLDVYKRQRERERLATLGEMSAGLAHEIRNPLGAIKGAAQLLEQNIKDKSSQQAQSEPFLNVILEEVDRLNKVVSQFLDYSKPISVREKSFINVQYLLDRTMDFLKSSFYNEISNKNIHFEVVPPKVGFENIPELHCVPEQIKQVLINLLQNSIHSLRRQEGNSNPQIKMGVEITPHRLNMVTSEADRDLNIYVEDNGCGFTADKIEKIFLPFYTENSKGTGLGLSISAKIIESHGGLIEAFSEPNKITRFTLVLPIDEKAVNGN
jgi:signal transduction histidine kinase